MRIESVFRRKRVFLPVIHVVSDAQALRNVGIAIEAAADGVFLINHDVRASELTAVYQEIGNIYPDLWMGLNLLDLETPRAIEEATALQADGLWVDDPGMGEDGLESPEDEGLLRRFNGLYFGSVAFKYQSAVEDVGRAARQAMGSVDVITTSGEATGKPPDVAKIETMRKAIGDHPLAIASGITPENIAAYLPLCDCFLVATGISLNHTELDPERAALLGERIHSFLP